MTLVGTIKLHQALHGYTDGHRQLAISVGLGARDTKTLLTLSDRAGPGLKIPIGGYLTGYPLAEASLYVLARTWAASELPRPGCVWTHSLLIDFTDLATIHDAAGLLRMFIRPGSGIPSLYHETVDFVPSASEAPDIAAPEARHILAALYGGPKDRVVATVAHGDPDVTVMDIWSQQWPRLRRAFRFCSLSAVDRSTESAPFDLQLVPPDKVVRSRFPKAVDAERVATAGTSWLDDALDDLLRPDAHGLRTFLRRVGGDVARGRDSFASLCRLRSMLVGLERDAPLVEEAISLLDQEFDAGQARFARIAVVQAAASRAESLGDSGLDFLIRNLEFLASDTVPETFLVIGAALWRRSPERVVSMLAESGPAHLIASSAIKLMPINLLIAGLHTEPNLSADILQIRPHILGEPAFWALLTSDTRLAFARAASDPDLAAATASALVASRPDLAYPAVDALGASCVGRAILKASIPTDVGRTWYEAVSAHPHAIAELFTGHAASVRQSLVQFARTMEPDTMPNEVGADPWITALTTSRGSVPEHDKAYFRAFIMARALGNRSQQAAELAIQTFEPIHSTLARREMPEDAWQLIEKRLPWSWADWDRCSRVRDAIGKLFLERRFVPAKFNKLTANDQLFALLAANMASSGRGRDYLKNVRKALKNAGAVQFASRIKVLDKFV